MEAVAYVVAQVADLIGVLFEDRLRKSRAGRFMFGILIAVVVFYYLLWALDGFPF
ncbi:hypothetical protein [Mesorhizobium sp.]|uniref:hypothetical protein n=1 Tax=Mesorhizobium sp. TaxID=1871066 RepID=UPI0025FF866E|nr:hypothetical protein [Mesorhizobium sp.]